MGKKLFAAAAAAALLSAQAQATCWSADEASAATVREFQSMLMVAALRCQVSGHDFTPDYNGFVIANRAAIGAVNDRLKAHFIHAAGPVGGQTAYDSFTTTLANGYGAAPTGAAVCANMGSLAREAVLMAGSIEGLAMLAGREGLTSDLPEGVCGAAPLTIANAGSAIEAAAGAGGAAPLLQTAAIQQ